jgi:hypothetical protein
MRIWYIGIFENHVGSGQMIWCGRAYDVQTQHKMICHATKAKIDPAPMSCIVRVSVVALPAVAVAPIRSAVGEAGRLYRHCLLLPRLHREVVF